MNKIKKFLMVIFCLTFLFLFTSCNPKLNGGNKDAKVSGNGSLVVQQGEYIYFVNGMTTEEQIQKDAENKNDPVKGIIMRQKINTTTGDKIGDAEVVVQDTFFTTYTGAGIFIFDDWIYYVTPNTARDKTGSMLLTQTLVKRVKIDGTKNKTIATIVNNSNLSAGFQYKITKNYFFYLDGSDLKAIDLQKNNFKVSTVADKVTSLIIPKSSEYNPSSNPAIFDYVLYTKNSEETVTGFTHNRILATNGNSTIVLMEDNAYFSNGNGWLDKENLKRIYVYSVLSASYENEDIIVYLKRGKILPYSGSEESEGLFEYKFEKSDGYKFNKDKNNVWHITKSDLSSFYPLGFQEGVLVSDTDKEAILYYKGISAQETIDKEILTGIMPETVKVFGSAVNILNATKNVIYYTDTTANGSLKRTEINVNNGAISSNDYEGYKPESNSQILILTEIKVDWVNPFFRSYDDGTLYFYFIYAYDYNYLARIKINSESKPLIVDDDSKIERLGKFNEEDHKAFNERT